MDYKKITFKINLLILTVVWFLAFGSVALGATGDAVLQPTKTGDAVQVQPVTLSNPLGVSDINTLAATIINNILGFVGTISLLLFIYGGLVLMTSAGVSAKIETGKNIIVYAVVGMAIVFTSYILVKFVIQGITGA